MINLAIRATLWRDCVILVVYLAGVTHEDLSLQELPSRRPATEESSQLPARPGSPRTFILLTREHQVQTNQLFREKQQTSE